MEKPGSFEQLNIDSVHKEQTSELLEAQAHIWKHILNYINSGSLKCAIQLGIPDIIHNHGKPMTLSELVSSLPIHQSKSHCVYRLMRILAHSGFFGLRKINENIDGEEEEGYVLSNTSKLLLKDNPLSVIPFLLLAVDPIFTQPWDFLSTWFQNDYPTAFDTAYGMTFWDYMSHEPRINKLFNEAMASDARLVARVVIERCKWVFEGLDSLVDVGGGTGSLAKAIADLFPHMECTVFYLPHVVGDLEGSKNLKYVGGDMFEAVPSAQAVLLKWILHDWSDEQNVKILRKCKEAIKSKGKEGKVIIIDMVVDNQKENHEESNETQFFFDMVMMVMFTGRERNENEWAKLIFEAGFSGYKITYNLGLRSLIEVYP